jgi:hypothetical protein
MNIQKRAKIAIAAVSLAGVVGLGGAAFTSTGVTSTAGPSQFVGGTVSQTVTGATLANIAYAYTDNTNTAVNQVTLTFADTNADGRPVAIALAAATPVGFTCENVGTTTTMVATCLPTTSGTSQTGLNGTTVTVS